MRTEKEMMQIIKKFVANDPNIRAALLNGSRTNPHVKPDPFQDYDIACYVRHVEPFKTDKSFLQQFGNVMIMQTPEDMEDPPPSNDGHYVYLMQFTDGNRIDLSFCPVDGLKNKTHESLSKILIDKDNTIKNLPPPSDRDFLPTAPTQKTFDDCCNEFWWVCPYVAKALWREELIHAKALLEGPIRTALMKMVTWHFAIQTNHTIAPGKDGKYIKPALAPTLWQKLETTYSNAQFENTWQALFAMGDVFRTTAQHVAQEHQFHHSEHDDHNVTQHLRHVHQLPKDATEIYTDV